MGFLVIGAFILGGGIGHAVYDPGWNSSLPLGSHRSGGLIAICDMVGTDVFLGLLKLMVLPLVMTGVISGMTKVGSLSDLRRIGIAAFVYYIVTMAIAASLGVGIVLAIGPGQGVEGLSFSAPVALSGHVATHSDSGFFSVVRQFLATIIPTNIFASLASGDTLSAIVFSFLFGIALVSVGERAARLVSGIEVLFEVFLRIVHAVLLLAPLGVFSLTLSSVARMGIESFGGAVGWYSVAVLGGLSLHGVVVLPLILWAIARCNPYLFMWRVRSALGTAFVTSSSSATIPVTLRAIDEEGSSKASVSRIVVPLGATVNMDGTALYEAVAVIFLAQVMGVALGPQELLIIVVTSTFAAIGAASIPSAGLVTMVIVVNAVNSSLLAMDPAARTIPLEAIGIILGVDRLLDMFRTMVNVWGDIVGVKVVSALSGTVSAHESLR